MSLKLVLNPKTDSSLERWRHELPGSGLLYGLKGVGLLTIARDTASSQSAQVVSISPEKATKTSQTLQIGVERIRELYEQTRTKTGNIRRVVIIDDAELMSLAAQNAFLKLLEEPNASTSFILTSHQPERLLTTVRSRLQALYVRPIDSSATRIFLGTLEKPHLVSESQLLFIADGLPAELARLVSDETALKAAIAGTTLAKNILESSAFDRLSLIAKEKPNRAEALLLVESLLRLIRLKPTENTPSEIEKLLTAYDRINGGGNIQAQLVGALL